MDAWSINDHRALVRVTQSFEIIQKDWCKTYSKMMTASRYQGVPLYYTSPSCFSVCIHQVTIVSQKWGHALCEASGQGESATTTLAGWLVKKMPKATQTSVKTTDLCTVPQWHTDAINVAEPSKKLILQDSMDLICLPKIKPSSAQCMYIHHIIYICIIAI